MGRAPRIDIGNQIYHVINRANARLTIFELDTDYKLFETILTEAVEKFNMRLLAYCIMPNHWHLAVYPNEDGDLSRFMQWLTLTHTQRYHVTHRTIGGGHLYQGRYKAFLVQTNEYALQLFRYIERNPVRAKLVRKAENWKWGSVHRRVYGTPEEKKLLTIPPILFPDDYLEWVNEPLSEEILLSVRYSVNKGKPLGKDSWTDRIIKQFGLELTLRNSGRPKNGT